MGAELQGARAGGLSDESCVVGRVGSQRRPPPPLFEAAVANHRDSMLRTSDSAPAQWARAAGARSARVIAARMIVARSSGATTSGAAGAAVVSMIATGGAMTGTAAAPAAHGGCSTS